MLALCDRLSYYAHTQETIAKCREPGDRLPIISRRSLPGHLAGGASGRPAGRQDRSRQLPRAARPDRGRKERNRPAIDDGTRSCGAGDARPPRSGCSGAAPESRRLSDRLTPLSIDLDALLRRCKSDKWRAQLSPRPIDRLVAAASLAESNRLRLLPDTNVYIRNLAGSLPATVAACRLARSVAVRRPTSRCAGSCFWPPRNGACTWPPTAAASSAWRWRRAGQ